MNSTSGPVGFTATSFASLSLNPPLISFNITDTSSSVAALRSADSVLIHLLTERQKDLARRFSQSAEKRFADTAQWRLLDTGEPLLRNAPYWLRATVQQLISAGDSTLVIGLVTHTHREQNDADPAAPLIYHDGAYLCARPFDE